MIIDEDTLPTLTSVINTQARKSAHKRGIGSQWEDIAQGVMVRVLEEDRANRLDQIEQGSTQFYTIIRKYTEQAVNNERIDYMYFTGNYVYDHPTVVNTLSTIVWGEPVTIDEVEKRVDVRAAFDRLAANYKLAIYRKYALGISAKPGAEAMALSRATVSIMHELNFRSAKEAIPLHHVETGVY